MKKLNFIFIIGLFLLVTGIFSFSASEKNITVNQGDDIQKAIDQGDSDITIIINSGEYSIEKSLNIKNKKSFKIIGKGDVKIIATDPQSLVIDISDSFQVRLENLHLTHTPRAEGCAEGVLSVQKSRETVIKNCILDGCGVFGIYANKVQRLALFGCEIKNNSWTGIQIISSMEIVLKDNKIFQNENPGIITGCKIVELRNNKIYQNKKNNELKIEKSTHIKRN